LEAIIADERAKRSEGVFKPDELAAAGD